MKKEITKNMSSGEFFASCKLLRIEELDRVYSDEEHYKAFKAKDDALYDKLKKALPEEMHGVLMNYSDNQFDFRMAQRSYFYKYGFMDSAHLSKVIYGGRTDMKLDITIL